MNSQEKVSKIFELFKCCNDVFNAQCKKWLKENIEDSVVIISSYDGDYHTYYYFDDNFEIKNGKSFKRRFRHDSHVIKMNNHNLNPKEYKLEDDLSNVIEYEDTAQRYYWAYSSYIIDKNGILIRDYNSDVDEYNYKIIFIIKKDIYRNIEDKYGNIK